MDVDSGLDVLERVTDDVVIIERHDAVTTAAEAPFSSLYDTPSGTVMAILCGLAIVVTIQLLVARIFRTSKTIIESLTFFATAMVAILVAVYVCDLLIAGPDVLLLKDGERSAIVNFVKDTCLMVFAYFFGTKSAATGSEINDPH